MFLRRTEPASTKKNPTKNEQTKTRLSICIVRRTCTPHTLHAHAFTSVLTEQNTNPEKDPCYGAQRKTRNEFAVSLERTSSWTNLLHIPSNFIREDVLQEPYELRVARSSRVLAACRQHALYNAPRRNPHSLPPSRPTLTQLTHAPQSCIHSLAIEAGTRGAIRETLLVRKRSACLRSLP